VTLRRAWSQAMAFRGKADMLSTPLNEKINRGTRPPKFVKQWGAIHSKFASSFPCIQSNYTLFFYTSGPAQIFSSPTDRARFPIVSGQQRNLHAVDDSALEGWIEIAHRLFIKVDDATAFERPDIVYLNDGALLGDFNKRVGGPIVFAVADTGQTSRVNQSGSPRSTR
jgi:hypothetical protein